MALEDLTGPSKFIANLVPANPTPDDFRDEGDDHIRGIKNVLKNSFPRGTGDELAQFIGMVAPFLGTPPAKWIPLDGRTITAAAYPELYAALGYVGSSSALPDCRGKFLRGQDNSAGYDPDGTRALGAVQGWAFPNHVHTLTDLGHSHWTMSDHTKPTTSGGSSDLGTPGSGGTNSIIDNVNNHTSNDSSGVTVSTIATLSADNGHGGYAGEVRPANVCVVYCVYAGR
jgi:microcystin-dependent protein